MVKRTFDQMCDTVVRRAPVKCGMRIAENRARVKCGMLHVEKYCGTKGKMRNVKNAEW